MQYLGWVTIPEQMERLMAEEATMGPQPNGTWIH